MEQLAGTQVLVAGAGALFQATMRRVAEEQGMILVGSTELAEDALCTAEYMKPDVAVVDASIQGSAPEQVAEEIRKRTPSCRVIFSGDPPYIDLIPRLLAA